jgi:hypothetical protein
MQNEVWSTDACSPQRYRNRGTFNAIAGDVVYHQAGCADSSIELENRTKSNSRSNLVDTGSGRLGEGSMWLSMRRSYNAADAGMKHERSSF